jgi:hypothetical protein
MVTVAIAPTPDGIEVLKATSERVQRLVARRTTRYQLVQLQLLAQRSVGRALGGFGKVRHAD